MKHFLIVISLCGLLVASAQETITWENAEQIMLLAVSENAPAPVTDTTLLSPDGSLQVIIDGQQLTVTDNTGAQWAVLEGSDFAQFAPDSRLLASANRAKNQIFLWQPAPGNQRQWLIAGHPPVVFSPDGRRIAYAGTRNTAEIASVAGIMQESADPVLAVLDGHFAPITALAFSPDGNLLATGSRDGTISLWESDAEIRVLAGHTHPITAIEFAGDQIISRDSIGQVFTWGMGAEIALPAYETEPVSTTANFHTMGIPGTNRSEITAGSHPMHAVDCVIPAHSPLLAVGRSAAGDVLVYSAFCEGASWLINSYGILEWETPLDNLPLIDVPDTTPLARLTNTAEICADAQAWGRLSSPTPARLYPPIGLPTQAQATIHSGVDVVICHDYPTVTIENCHYLGPGNNPGGNYSYIYIRHRTDDEITLVDYHTGKIIGQQRFRGEEPPLCPQERERGEVFGAPPAARVWVPWTLETVGYLISAPVRTGVSYQAILAYPEPDTQVEAVATLAPYTPLNLIGQDSTGEWAAVLLPDLTRAWVQMEYIEVVYTNQRVPVVSGRAEAIQIEVRP